MRACPCTSSTSTSRKKDPAIHPPDHISLNTAQTRSSYRTDIIGIQYLVERIQRNHKILIIDTTFRSGQVVNDVLLQLKDALRRNLTLDHVRVASIYYNPTDTSTWTVPRIIPKPHYFVREVHTEIIYPQSVHKLARPEVELRERNARLHRVLYGRADVPDLRLEFRVLHAARSQCGRRFRIFWRPPSIIGLR